MVDVGRTWSVVHDHAESDAVVELMEFRRETGVKLESRVVPRQAWWGPIEWIQISTMKRTDFDDVSRKWDRATTTSR